MTNKDDEIRNNLHHTLMVILGLRNRLACPECGSTEDFHMIRTYDIACEVFDDGHEKEYDRDYSYGRELCWECGYECD